MKAVEQDRRPAAGDRIYLDGMVQQIVSASDVDLWLCDAACTCKSFDHKHLRRSVRGIVWDSTLEMFTRIEYAHRATQSSVEDASGRPSKKVVAA
jgi:hypothetical protein